MKLKIRWKSSLWTLALLLGVATANTAYGQAFGVVGHSFAGLQCQHWQSDGMPGTVACAWHNAFTCANLLTLLPSDLRFIQTHIGRPPDYVIVWNGTNDAEQHIARADFAACAATYYRTIQSTFPTTTILWMNVPPLAQITQPTYGDTRPYIEGYNAAVTPPVVDVWTLTAMPNGWANIAYIPGIHPSNAGWRVIETAQIRALAGNK
jgi:hypothetical protein